MSAPVVLFPTTVAEAVEMLDAYDGEAKLIAGGTAMSLLLQYRLIRPAALVSLQRVADLRAVRRTEDGRGVRLGALVTHAEAAENAMLVSAAPLVAESFSVVGNPQVRTAATVGGVLAEADYASDPPAALRAADAVATVEGPTGRRCIPVAELLLGFYETALSPAEVIVDVIVPSLPPDAGSAYLKYSSRSSEDRPCVGVAAVVRQTQDGRCAEVRIAVGATTAAPVRLPALEASAVGLPLDPAALGGSYAEAVKPLEDARGSSWYRREMVRVWVERALTAARLRCRDGAPEVPLRRV